MPNAGADALELPDHGTRLQGPLGKKAEVVALASFEDVEKLWSEDEVWNAVLLFRFLNQEAPAR